jgi:ZIP family zinc transporter
MTAIYLSFVTFGSTLGGGLLALRHRDRLHYLLGFAAGVLLGVVAFEVLPEIFGLAREHALDVTWAMGALVVGFLFFHSLEKFVLVHHAHEADYATHRHPDVGVLSALALVGHSLLDGVGIGLAFQASESVGISVVIAVIAHDCCDGLNTVGLMLAHRNGARRSLAMLVLDAVAPVVGVASTLLFQVPPSALMVYLGFFAGFLLYIGVADILPEAHSRACSATAVRLMGLTALGAMLVLGLAGLARIASATSV